MALILDQENSTGAMTRDVDGHVPAAQQAAAGGNLSLYLCCRADGDVDTAIDLPNQLPLLLFTVSVSLSFYNKPVQNIWNFPSSWKDSACFLLILVCSFFVRHMSYPTGYFPNS